MNTDRLKSFLEAASEIERTEFIKNEAQRLHKLRKQMDNALKRELDTDAYCTRAKRTTLYANSQKVTDQYNNASETLKYTLNFLY